MVLHNGTMRQCDKGETLHIAISYDVNYKYKENSIRYMNYVESSNNNTRDSSKPTWQVTIWIRSRASLSQRIFEWRSKSLSSPPAAHSVSLSAPKCSTPVATKHTWV